MVIPMPDATEDDIFILENRIKEAKPISKMLDEEMTLEEIAKDITGDQDIQAVEENMTPKFECNCSKEKMANGLATIGKTELKSIIEEDKKAELVCHFCNKKYEFTEQELIEILKELN